MKDRIKNPYKIVTLRFHFQEVPVEVSYYHGRIFHVRMPSIRTGIYRNSMTNANKPAIVYVDGKPSSKAEMYILDSLFRFIDLSEKGKYNEIRVLDKQLTTVARQFRQMVSTGELTPDE